MSDNSTQKISLLVQKLNDLEVNNRATLVCLAEEALQAGDKDLYRDLKNLSTSFNHQAEAILSRYGVARPQRPKPKLHVVK